MQSLDKQVQAIVGWAYERTTLMKQRLERAGISPTDIQTVSDLEKIPVFTKDEAIALQQAEPPFGGMLAVPMSEVRHIFFSPGPLYEPDAGNDQSLLNMAQLALQQSGFGAEDVVLNTLSYHLVPAGLLLDTALTSMGCVVVPGGVGNTDLQIKMMADLQVTGYVGTPSFLAILLKRAEEMGLKQLALSKAFVTAEPLFAHQRQLFTETYKLTVGNAYATAELGFLALNRGSGLAMQLLPEPIVQIVDPDTGKTVGAGEVGEVVVTNFNQAYPLIRFGTGDMAVNADPHPGHSQQEERALILVGRRGEAAKVRGMFIHPNQLRFAVNQVMPARALQAVITHQQEQDHFSLRIVPVDPNPNPELAEKVALAVRQSCRVRVDELLFVEERAIEGNAGILDRRAWT